MKQLNVLSLQQQTHFEKQKLLRYCDICRPIAKSEIILASFCREVNLLVPGLILSSER